MFDVYRPLRNIRHLLQYGIIKAKLTSMTIQHPKKIFLTGGTSGIGRATTLLLAKEGYTVFIVGRNTDKVRDLLRDAQLLGIKQHIHYILQDVSDIHALEDLLPKTWASHGPFDILINNAGVAFDSVIGIDSARIQHMINTNLTACLRLSGFFIEHMIKAGIEGDVINIGSMSSSTRDAESSGYVASKAAIQGFTESLRKEANPHGIRVSLIEPGSVGTDMQPQSAAEQRLLQEKLEMLKAEDIAHAIEFILKQDRRVTIVEMHIKPLRQFI